MKRFAFAGLSLVAFFAFGCASAPESDSSVELESVATAESALKLANVPNKHIYFNSDNVVHNDGKTYEYGVFDLNASASAQIHLIVPASPANPVVGFKVYEVKKNGNLSLVKSVSGANGDPSTILTSKNGGTYAVQVVSKMYTNPVAINLGCVSNTICTTVGQPGDACGSRGLKACDDGLSCIFDEGSCGADDKPGVCSLPFEFCPAVVTPVCGCDGQTYNNSCEAQRAGASVAHTGACAPANNPNPGQGEGELCGGIAGLLCADGLSCIYEEGTCNTADAAGTCVKAPQGCIRIFAPVCGCDGKTYGNSCNALAAGVSIDHDGPCGSTTPQCPFLDVTNASASDAVGVWRFTGILDGKKEGVRANLVLRADQTYELGEEYRPVCDPGKACPMYIRMFQHIGTYTIDAKGQVKLIPAAGSDAGMTTALRLQRDCNTTRQLVTTDDASVEIFEILLPQF